MPVLHVLRVFCDNQGQFGSSLGVVLDGFRRTTRASPITRLRARLLRDRLCRRPERRPTAHLHTGRRAALRGTPTCRHGLAPQPPPQQSRDTAEPTCRTFADLDQRRLRVDPRAPLAVAPFWRLNHVASAASVDAMTEALRSDQDADQFWAWIDQQAGIVRARVFAARYGVPQDEACGSASMLLAARLGRAITIRHGSGSLVQASPAANGMADVGGRVIADHERVVD
jgi:predicted PhzF superfamily epimerase YddE/YHI9